MEISAFPAELPVNLNLAADQRFSHPDYANDQIWELMLRGGDPQSLSLHTTYGLRAIRMAFFPRFLYKDADLIDPLDFHQAPRITASYPNFARVVFMPFEGLQATLECWATSSQVMAMRIDFTNMDQAPLKFTFELVGILQPLDRGERLAITPFNLTNILQGRTDELSPVCFMTGGPFPGIGPYAGLAQHFVLNPGHDRSITAAIAAAPNEKDSLQLARESTACAWDEEIARIERVNQSQWLEISTGDPQWDACFHHAQATALELLMPPSDQLPNASFVQSRRPDHGHSLRGDGSDYPHLWSGQTALDAWYLNSFLLPGGLQTAKGIVENFLHVQEEDGRIDWKPGLAGQRSRRLAQPLLAALACQVHEWEGDDAWLETCFLPLLKFFTSWFTVENDSDEDGLPEWKHALQTGFSDAPIYNHWQQNSQGVEITILECPSLAAFLYHECTCLIKIAKKLEKPQTLPWLEAKALSLQETIASMWNARSKTFRYRDSLTNNSNKGRVLRTIKGQGKMSLQRNFNTPQRLLIRLDLANNDTRPLKITIKGRDDRRKVSETIGIRQLHWANGTAVCTTNNVFMQVEEVNIHGLSPEDTGTLSTVDYAQEDITLLLPLWSRSIDEKIAKTLVEKTIMPRYLKKFGLSATPQSVRDKSENWKAAVHMPWNQLIGEGLLAYGYRNEAARLVKNLMQAHTSILANHRHFHETFHAENGEPGGEESILTGLPPLGLFLKVLGIRRLTGRELIVEGHNPFSKPVTIRFQAITITREKKNTIVTLQSGETLTLRGAGPHHVRLQ